MFSRLTPLILIFGIGLAAMFAFRLPQLHFVQDIGAEVFAPIQGTLSGSSRGVSDFFESIRTVGELKEQNALLRAQVAQLTQQTVRVPELEQQNQELQAELNFKRSSPDYQWIQSKVIYADPSNLVQSVTIDRGSKDGVRDGMTVITPGGLVGRIVSTSPATARVLLITDSSSSVTAMLQGSRAVGVVNGQRTEVLQMGYIPQSATVRTGDKVVTSGVGGVFPEGILVGSITSVSRKDTDMFQTAQIEPAVDFSTLDTVLVIINHLPMSLN